MTTQQQLPKLPPRWFIRSAWVGHRLLYRTTGKGLARPHRDGKMGMLRLHTVGRRSGEPREAILGFYEHEGSFVTLAMNGWAEADPAWWINLRAHPQASVDTVDGPVAVAAREAKDEERERLLAEFDRYTGWGDISELSVRRPHTAVVVLDRA
ncbi:nitroreductase family deazaflavin-dependent oxidoreductase [Agrococcus beijingensis]|uniref:nitroreductase family deazaflavin-dependent oxidoreductase n=1 Tax=Agrococcus beijingensis TaxID=3068634 RepID=UPI002741BEE6|nr:nitroreductase family deazaflavin-dependent oxidoreductase [Agrococcus sp. REN33]